MQAATRRSPALALLLLALLLAACNGGDARAPAGSPTPGGSGPATATPPAVEATATAFPLPTAPAATATTGSASELLEPDADRAFEHIRVLADEIGSRVAATDEERRAADYIAGQLEAAGYRVEIELFAVELTRDRSTVELSGGARLESTLVLLGSPNGTASGPLVRGNLGRPDDLADLDATGAVLLLDRGLITFAEKALNAEAAGAVAVIVVNNVPGPLLSGSLGDTKVTIPVVGASTDDGVVLDYLASESLASEGEPVTVRADRRVATGQSQNVVGRASERCDAYLGAHYDSVEAGPGANDNASGTAMLLELARTHHVEGLCAVAFGSEESGLWGSRAFVQAHDVSGARFMLNFDVVAKITGPIFVATEDDPASMELADRAAAAAAERGIHMPRGAFPQFSSSDHASFSAAGVPAITIYAGDDPLMHGPSDDLDNVSRDDLATMLRVADVALRALLAR